MARYEESIDIDAPPADVWRVLADLERWPEWTPSMREVRPLSGDGGEGGLTVGGKVRVRQPKLPTVTWTVDEVEPGRSFSWRSDSPGMASRAEHRIEPTGAGSHVVLVLEQTGPFAGVTGLFYARLIRRYVRAEAEGLKKRAEG